ncbi:MAG TPA: SIS domain-containing protein [Patescibacteria group bacterium]
MAKQILDSRELIEKVDVANVLGSIEQLGSQVQHIWELAQQVPLDESYKNVNCVVVAGMGGSALGTHVIQTVFKDEIKVPVLISPDYDVPSFVDEKTLVIASSYSGNTEETLAATQDAINKKAKVVGITSGGKLAKLLTEKNLPVLVFEPTYNPSNSPRMALGYSVFGQIALFSQAGLLKITQDDYTSVLEAVAQAHLLSGVNVKTEANPAKLLAFEMIDHIPVLTAAQHLEGITHVFANQINENSKQFSEYRVVPELNHHLMEGLQFPKTNDSNLLFVTIHSNLYLKSNQVRMDLTQQVLEQNDIEFRTFDLKSASKLEQAFELLTFGAYVSFYLAMLNNQNPAPNPWVDWFKDQLKKG